MMAAMRKRRDSRAYARIAVVVLLCFGAACSGSSSKSGGSAQGSGRPVRENVTFFYQQVANPRVLARFGKVKMVVAAPQTDGAKAAALIKSTGAKAYRYLQVYWLPTSNRSDDPESSAHQDWFFCAAGESPVVGRTDRQGDDWYFYDMNERAALERLSRRLQAVKAEGWDGVFFDRGQAALSGIDDPSVKNVWDQVSSCTSDPVTKGATFADAYVRATKEAHAAGLELMMNYGVFNQQTPLRPDPRDPDCRRQNWAKCHHLGDAWAGLDFALDEAPAHPTDVNWDADYRVNQLAEQDPQHGGHVVGLLTTGTLGENNRTNVYFEWARVKLFVVPLAVNTGNAGCASAYGAPCNRHALYPELADIAYGKPIDKEPVKTECQKHSRINCVWVRHYEHGMSVVNVSDRTRTVKLELETQGCRVVNDIWLGKPLASGACVTKAQLVVPAWSGRPLTYSASTP
jgi:hypothetical protein